MKRCNPKLAKANDNKYICNPKTGRWVLKTGNIGKAVQPPRLQRVRHVQPRPIRRVSLGEISKIINSELVGAHWKEVHHGGYTEIGQQRLINTKNYGTITRVIVKRKKVGKITFKGVKSEITYYECMVYTNLTSVPVIFIQYNGINYVLHTADGNLMNEIKRMARILHIEGGIEQTLKFMNLLEKYITFTQKQKRARLLGNVMAVGKKGKLPHEMERNILDFLS